MQVIFPLRQIAAAIALTAKRVAASQYVTFLDRRETIAQFCESIRAAASRERYRFRVAALSCKYRSRVSVHPGLISAPNPRRRISLSRQTAYSSASKSSELAARGRLSLSPARDQLFSASALSGSKVPTRTILRRTATAWSGQSVPEVDVEFS